MKLVGFDWDQGNREKCLKHGVATEEIEYAFREGRAVVRPDPAHSERETRFQAVGLNSNGRHVFIVFTLREKEDGIWLRPISARYMHRKEIARYEEDNPGLRQ